MAQAESPVDGCSQRTPGDGRNTPRPVVIYQLIDHGAACAQGVVIVGVELRFRVLILLQVVIVDSIVDVLLVVVQFAAPKRARCLSATSLAAGWERGDRDVGASGANDRVAD